MSSIDTKDFLRRFHTQKQEDSGFRVLGGKESGNAWEYPFGDYSSSPRGWLESGTRTLHGIEYQNPRKRIEDLKGTEQSIAKILEENLKTNEKAPIIGIDYGGGLGVTWNRLALAFEKDILAGKLLLIVTNMEQKYKPIELVNSNVSRVPEEFGDLIKNVSSKRILKYIVAELTGNDSSEVKSLRQLKVKYCGQKVPLIGNVDLIHTRLSLMHTQIPEFHFPRIFELLSKTGTFIDTGYEDKTPAVNPKDTPTVDDTEVRRAILETYKREIKLFNLHQVEFAETGPNKGKKLFATVLRKKDQKDLPIYS